MGSYKENMEFEAEARRVVEALFGASPGECQPEHYADAGPLRELDGLLRLRDVTHLIMVTTSTKLQKAKDDIKKLEVAARAEEKLAPAVAMWLITEKQLDAEHLGCARKANVTVLTLEQLRRRFFDGRNYIEARRKAAFGSARNLKDDSVSIPLNEYVPLPMQATENGLVGVRSRAALPKSVTVDWISDRLAEGGIIVVVAPFGAGKSLTTREVFLRLSQKYENGLIGETPVALNLREHWGQDDAEEMLDRHARKVGFDKRRELYSAWRAGMLNLLLDGFDEVGSQVVASRDNKRFLTEARHRALKGVRELITNRPQGMGVLVCGRDHYFDAPRELEQALGIAGVRQYWTVQVGEFTDSGIQDFLRRAGSTDMVPGWLPRKPLLLAYLVHHQLLPEVLGIDADRGFGYVWDAFIDRICAREVKLEGAAMDAHTIRQVLEYLAHKVRATRTGLGPITGFDLAEAYERVAGEAPGEGVLPHLQRLPALSAVSEDPGNRSFVDEDMLYALQGGALVSIVDGAFVGHGVRPLDSLRRNAVKMASYKCSENAIAVETVVAVAERIDRNRGRAESQGEFSSPQLIADCFELAMDIAVEEERPSVDFRGLVVRGAVVGEVRADEVLPIDLEFADCHIQELRLAPLKDSHLPFRVVGGMITQISGAASFEGVPVGLIDAETEIGQFDVLSTNAEVLRSDLSPGLKALLTVLRKLYKQAGAGRKIAAFHRGITDQEVRDQIDPIIRLLEREGLLRLFNHVAHPVRALSARVERILAAPMLSDDPICEAARRLVDS